MGVDSNTALLYWINVWDCVHRWCIDDACVFYNYILIVVYIFILCVCACRERDDRDAIGQLITTSPGSPAVIDSRSIINPHQPSSTICFFPVMFNRPELRKHGMQGLRELQQKQRRSRISGAAKTRPFRTRCSRCGLQMIGKMMGKWWENDGTMIGIWKW